MRLMELPTARRSQVTAYRKEAADARVVGSDAAPQIERDANLWNVAELYWVTREMTAVALDAAGDMPPWTIEALCPTDVGFLFYEGGLPPLPAQDVDPTRGAFGQEVRPQISADYLRWWRHGTRLNIEYGCLRHRATHRDYEFDSPFISLGVVNFDAEGRAIDPRSDGDDVSPSNQYKVDVVLLLGCTWALMGQENVTATHRELVPSSKRRRGRLPTAVTTITLRRLRSVDDSPIGDSGRIYSHRWVVRGHWRQQAFGPQHGQRRPVWIPSYIKGPADAPLLVTERINVWRR